MNTRRIAVSTKLHPTMATLSWL